MLFEEKSMAHQCAAIPHTWCKTAVAESSSATAVVSVPNLRSKAPTHHQVFWLMQLGAAEDLPKTPRAASCLLMGKRPTMAAFRRKAAQLQIQLRGKPRIPTGFLLIPPPRSGARDDDTMYAFICTKYHAGLQLSMPFSLPAAFSRCPPKNPHREEPPPASGAEGGWVRVLARTRLERK